MDVTDLFTITIENNGRIAVRAKESPGSVIRFEYLDKPVSLLKMVSETIAEHLASKRNAVLTEAKNGIEEIQ